MSACRHDKLRLSLANGNRCVLGTKALLQLPGRRCSAKYLLGRLLFIETPDCQISPSSGRKSAAMKS